MSVIKETVFSNRDNAIRLALSEDGVLFRTAYPSTSPTRWVLSLDAEPPITIDSTMYPQAFFWDANHSILELRLGAILTTAFPYTPTHLVMYAAEWPGGLVWINPTCTPNKMLIRVCDST